MTRGRKICQGIAVLLALAATGMQAQPAEVPEITGMADNVCPPPLAMPGSVKNQLTAMLIDPPSLTGDARATASPDASFNAYFAELRPIGSRDWPGLCRFQADNARLRATAVNPHVVFMGDSITENWLLGDPGLFGDDFVNRGIGGQTSPQMLLRFRADVVDLHPAWVHILAGTNDVAGNTGPNTPQDFRNNVMSMVELAQASGIQVLLGSIPPSAGFYWAPAMQPAPQIRALNSWMQQYAAEQKLVYVDYHAALAGQDGGLPEALGNDGVHPNRDGYVIMRSVLEKALQTAGTRQ